MVAVMSFRAAHIKMNLLCGHDKIACNLGAHDRHMLHGIAPDEE
jgi:hypothetical protein